MTRRPIPFPGSAFFFGPAPAPGRRGGPRHDETKPRRQDAPVAAALCRTKGSPARSRTEGKRSTRNAPLRSALRPREPRTRPPGLSLRTALKAAPTSAPVLPGKPRAAARRYARPGGLAFAAHSSRQGQHLCSLRILPALRFRKLPSPPPRSATPLQPLSPQPSPASGPADKKKPRRPGAKHEEGKRSRLNRPTAGT